MGHKLVSKSTKIDNNPERMKYHSYLTKAITVGDLHGSFQKLLYALLFHKIIEIEPPLYAKFCRIYKIHPSSLTAANLSDFQHFLNAITLLEPNVLIRLIGDETADRGFNDYFTLLLLEKITHLQAQVCGAGKIKIICSNHGAEFIRAYEKYAIHGKVLTPFRINHTQLPSMLNLHLLLDNKNLNITWKSIKSLINTIYKPALVVLDYELDTINRYFSIYSHAPIDLSCLPKIAKLLNIENSLEFTPQGIKNLIDTINQTFQENYVQTESVHQLCYETYQSSIEKAYSDDDYKAIFLGIIWNRYPQNLNRKPSILPGYTTQFVHGHHNCVSEYPTIINLDDDFGKSPHQTNESEYFNSLITHSGPPEENFSFALSYKTIKLIETYKAQLIISPFNIGVSFQDTLQKTTTAAPLNTILRSLSISEFTQLLINSKKPYSEINSNLYNDCEKRILAQIGTIIVTEIYPKPHLYHCGVPYESIPCVMGFIVDFQTIATANLNDYLEDVLFPVLFRMSEMALKTERTKMVLTLPQLTDKDTALVVQDFFQKHIEKLTGISRVYNIQPYNAKEVTLYGLTHSIQFKSFQSPFPIFTDITQTEMIGSVVLNNPLSYMGDKLWSIGIEELNSCTDRQLVKVANSTIMDQITWFTGSDKHFRFEYNPQYRALIPSPPHSWKDVAIQLHCYNYANSLTTLYIVPLHEPFLIPLNSKNTLLEKAFNLASQPHFFQKVLGEAFISQLNESTPAYKIYQFIHEQSLIAEVYGLESFPPLMSIKLKNSLAILKDLEPIPDSSPCVDDPIDSYMFDLPGLCEERQILADQESVYYMEPQDMKSSFRIISLKTRALQPQSNNEMFRVEINDYQGTTIFFYLQVSQTGPNQYKINSIITLRTEANKSTYFSLTPEQILNRTELTFSIKVMQYMTNILQNFNLSVCENTLSPRINHRHHFFSSLSSDSDSQSQYRPNFC